MGDVIFVAMLIAFFAIAAVFVRACDKIIGEDTAVGDRGNADTGAQAEPERVAA